MSERKRITIFVLHDEDASDFDWVRAWLDKWADKVTISDYSSGGWEHLWDVEAPKITVTKLDNFLIKNTNSPSSSFQN